MIILKSRFWFSRSVRVWDFTFLTSSQVMLILLVHEPHMAIREQSSGNHIAMGQLNWEHSKKGLKFSVPSNIISTKLGETCGTPNLVLDHLTKILWWEGRIPSFTSSKLEACSKTSKLSPVINCGPVFKNFTQLLKYMFVFSISNDKILSKKLSMKSLKKFRGN